MDDNLFSKIVPALGAGIMSVESEPGKYYLQSQWKGNGLANTGIGYIKNPYYVNPYDFGQMLNSTFSGGQSNSTQSKTSSIKNKLGDIVKILLGNDNQSDWYNSVDNDYYNMMLLGDDKDLYDWYSSDYYSNKKNIGDFYNNIGGIA